MVSDLISRAAAIDYLMTNMGWHDEDGYEVDDAEEKKAIITDLVNGIPDVDAAPVVHAKWILIQNGSGVCSACNRNDHIDSLAAYCRYCGARMDGGDENATN